MLEQLESQVVPPDFHQTPTSDDATSPFGSQHWEGEAVNGGTNGVQRRGKWKTLRDFVYERAIVEAIETIDRDRNDLDVGGCCCVLPVRLTDDKLLSIGYSCCYRRLPATPQRKYPLFS